jgi:hypothetical protein
MVGYGINDAGSSLADIGIASAPATDVAMESAVSSLSAGSSGRSDGHRAQQTDDSEYQANRFGRSDTTCRIPVAAGRFASVRTAAFKPRHRRRGLDLARFRL